MKEAIESFVALPFLVQGIVILALSTLLSIGRSAWYRLFYRRGWYPEHRSMFHWPLTIAIASVAGMVLAVSEQLGWLLVVPTAVFFFLVDAPLMKAQQQHT
jgi:cell division protein FtsX